MLRLIPFVLAAVVIVSMTVIEGGISDRWSTSNHMLDAYVEHLGDAPNELGNWVGTDEVVDDRTQIIAGAKGYVSRDYVNEKEKAFVNLWLIAGHARDTSVHTPDVCYPSQGYQPEISPAKHVMTLGNGDEVEFWTAVFTRSDETGEHSVRVFWTWFRPEKDGGEVVWQAPGDKVKSARYAFGGAKTLMKLYFTAPTTSGEAPEDNVAIDFAELFLPELNKVLADAWPPTQEG
ncbi:hypothetical protein Mal64_21950 [Pseudobythopirellula maris]|uniref:Methanolan biosynthesis EpsI domain-containing protein n=1 Tax=Pseudobythopirellula maris TaxID=2527991 RepID=A0A5C5ZP56_9BACT|nr:exosortase-associated EpsI family protein [Pseudobythopirellula maris]TWT88707.1 hypothetical protein Mal64_21950 [Pseudobythopirellula maris]